MFLADGKENSVFHRESDQSSKQLVQFVIKDMLKLKTLRISRNEKHLLSFIDHITKSLLQILANKGHI